MKKQLIAACCCVGVLMGFSQQTVKGTVYCDTNHNGKQDRKEAGIAKVSVTNGTQVVQTDVHGNFELAASSDMIVSVIKPSNYAFPLDTYNLPKYYYIHKPEGSSATKFQGVQPTGKLPKKLSFGLYPSEEKEDFSILVFGDPQPYNQEQLNFFEEGVVKEVAATKEAVLGISLGDLVGNDLSLFEPYKKVMTAIGIPWHNVIGNHDLNFDVAQDYLSDESYEAHFGPANNAFNYGKVHFIVLDDILYPDPRGGKHYWGGFREDQLQFIANDLQFVPKDHLIVLAFHIPLSEPEIGNDTFRDTDRNELFQLLKDYPYTLSLSAHTHIQKQDEFDAQTGWQQKRMHHEYNAGTTSGDWYSGKLNAEGIPEATMRDGTPKGYSFIDFKGTTYSIRYKVAGKPASYQMEVYAPKVVAKAKRTKSPLYVNFFMGSANDVVTYRTDNGEWKKMKYVNEPDPSYVSQLIHWDEAETLPKGKRGSNAIDCTHLWTGSIEANLSEGIHTIEIKAIDRFGAAHSAQTTYRIESEN
ncbi:3',5'-cyclic AMP phosphodiesterase CpdA [Pustulibacterium marinum]|uniref:3',5'-cyclic AMP phosphodiesterase CpdA n=1 Tax=Pustulibacterium marinum TaxID=1224947 RepID=A0A1I7GEQ4_9FLAO|nr:calcineurin-like phosphoesterase C-terminal domain-containing protein [Pustulibacterium marinum]SFU46939.1 3',5'-cyclic AMP phosphodiesterase CpdA [Pustulibacterium marinum]